MSKWMLSIFNKANSAVLFSMFFMLWALLTYASAIANQPDKPAVMLIIDGSSSMWGKIDGTSKISITRKAAHQFLQNFPKNRALGIMAYGHRKPGKCTDIQLLAAPEKNKQNKLKAALNKINPRGKTPLALSLLKAARTLKYEKKPAKIILLTDGLDNCSNDPCKIAHTLKANAKNITIDVITLGLGTKPTRKLACIAKQTGGHFLQTTNGAQLTAAFQTLNKSLKKDSHQTTTPLKQDADADPILALSASLGPKSPALTEAVHWMIFKTADRNQTNNTALPAPVFEAKSPAIHKSLPPGNYVIEAQFETYAIRHPISLAAGKQYNQRLVFFLSTIVMPPLSLPPNRKTGTGFIRLKKNDPNDQFTQPLFFKAGDKEQSWLVPAGSYLINYDQNGINHKFEKQFIAGKRSKIVLWQNFGRLKLDFDLAKPAAFSTAPANHLARVITVAPVETTSSTTGGKNTLTRKFKTTSFGNIKEIDLAAGTYDLVLKQGLLKAQKQVTITAGQIRKEPFEVKHSQLKIALDQSLIEQSNQPLLRLYQQSVQSAPSSDKWINIYQTNQIKQPINLAPGQYKLSLKLSHSIGGYTEEFALKDGQAKTITPKFQVGFANLAARKNNNDLAPLISWHLFDERGKAITHGVDLFKNLALKAGRYTLRARLNHKSLKKSFEVAPGQSVTVYLSE